MVHLPAPRSAGTRRSRLLLAATLVALLVVPRTAPGAAARTPAAPDPAAQDQPVIPDDRLAPALAGVPVEGEQVEAALDAYRVTETRLDDAVALAERSDAELAALDDAAQRLERRRTEAQRRQAKSRVRLEELGRSLRGLVVADFVRGGTGSVNDPTVDLADLSANDRRRVLVEAAYGEQLDEARAHRTALALATSVADATEAELAEVRRRIAATTAVRDGARATEAEARAQLVVDGQAVADARLLSTVIGTDLPLVALDAYVRAAAVESLVDPACELPWALLAGIGRTESHHGSYGDAELQADGRSDPPVLGILLDGTRSARITDTDGGLLDGDAAFDRAVGPMQFIPGTWQRWQRDGNGDLLADPHNLYDASAAAAAYLCASTTGLTSEPAARRALLSYNRSTTYGTTVLRRAAAYAEAVPLPGPQPPAVADAGDAPPPPPAPAAPGAPEQPASPTATLPDDEGPGADGGAAAPSEPSSPPPSSSTSAPTTSGEP